MDNRASLASLLFICILHIAVRCIEAATNVTVFYETHCPDSQKLIVNQVIPSVEHFGPEIHVELVPYGFAHYTTVNNGTTLSFKCQHGPMECEGNIVHACIQQHYHTRQEDVVRFAGCTMQHGVKVLDFVNECAKRYEFNPSTLKRCASSDEGLKLLQEMGDRTAAAARVYSPTRGKFSFIPTTFIDGKPYVQEAVADLTGTICRVASPQPKKC